MNLGDYAIDYHDNKGSVKSGAEFLESWTIYCWNNEVSVKWGATTLGYKSIDYKNSTIALNWLTSLNLGDYSIDYR
jgi:hypothetical protein